MAKPRVVAENPSLSPDQQSDQVLSEPVDTDDNDEPFADASGDSQDETPEENDAPDAWHKGE